MQDGHFLGKEGEVGLHILTWDKAECFSGVHFNSLSYSVQKLLTINKDAIYITNFTQILNAMHLLVIFIYFSFLKTFVVFIHFLKSFIVLIHLKSFAVHIDFLNLSLFSLGLS